MPTTPRQLCLSLTTSLVCLSVVSLVSAQEAPGTDTNPAASSPLPPSPAEGTAQAVVAESIPVAETAGAPSGEPTTKSAVSPSIKVEAPVALAAPPAGTGGIAVFPVAGTNLTEGEIAALGVLFASEFRDEKGGRVIPPDLAAKYSRDSSEQQAAAAHLNVEQYVSVEAVRLDRTTIVTATLYNQDGSVVRSEKMSAKSVDDFQHVSERLVIALLEGKSIENTRTLDNITADEAEGNNRTFVEKVFGFKTSWVVPYSSKIDLPMMVGASFDGRLEGKSYFLEFGAGLLLPAASEGMGGSGYGGVFAEIGGSAYLTYSSVSPYVGAGVMPRILSTQPANLAVYGQAGLMFFRTSSSRLYAEVRVAQNLTPMDVWDSSPTPDYDDYSFYDDFTVTVWPIEFGLNVGLGW